MSWIRRMRIIMHVANGSKRRQGLGLDSLLPIGANCLWLSPVAASNAAKSSSTKSTDDPMNLIGIVIALGVAATPGLAQNLILRGQIVDESGGVVPAATVSLTGPGGLSRATKTRD